MKKILEKIRSKQVACYVAGQLLAAKACYAALPWDDTIDIIVDSVTGPVAKGIAVIAVVIGGLGIAFTDGSFTKKFLMIAMGLAVALMAARFINALFGV